MERVIARELMDDAVDSIAELRANLYEIERINRLLGTTGDVVRALAAAKPQRVLDVGCGLADIPLAVARAYPTAALTCLDRSSQILGLARERAQEHPRLEFVCADAIELPFPDGTFDAVMCNLALHHFDPPHAGALLRELRRVSRSLVLITDLCRSRVGHALARAVIGTFSRNRLTRHDGPLSVRRAYTPSEALALAQSAGWLAPRVRVRPFFRMILRDG